MPRSKKTLLSALLLLAILFIVLDSRQLHNATWVVSEPQEKFKSWRTGVVTVDTPQIEVNCSKLITGDEEEIERVSNLTSSWESGVSDETMLEKVRDCSWLKEYFRDNLYNSELEKSFPMAFTFVVYDSPQQVLRLLRLLYRPQNSYCIHCDAKSNFTDFFQSIADCLDNVIVPSKLVRVVWGHYSVLGAQMNCMTDLLQLRSNSSEENKWKYLLNLCGKELPLVTHREIVSRLMKLNGSSAVHPYLMSNHSIALNRIKFQAILNVKKSVVYSDTKTPLYPPFNVSQYYKSQSYMALSYQFTNYLTTNSTAINIHEFFKKCRNPEEHFYATMFMMPGVPGGYDEKVNKSHYFVMESTFWMDHSYQCHGKIVHNICIVGTRDLANVLGNHNLFHNKYFMEYDHTVMRCMEERIVQRNKLEYQQDYENNAGRIL